MTQKKSRGRPMHARPRILAAAHELFLEQGLDVTLNDIAVQAGTTRQTLYSHFTSKTALLIEVFSGLKADLKAPFLDSTIDTMSLNDLLPQIGQAVQAHFYDTTVLRLLRLLIVALVQMPDVLPEIQQRSTGSIRRSLARVLMREHARGVIEISCPEDAAKAFLGAIIGPMFPAALLGNGVPDASELQRLNQEVCRTFLRAWRPV